MVQNPIVFIHGVAGQEQTGHFLFHLQALILWKLLHLGQIEFKTKILPAGQLKETHLPVTQTVFIFVQIADDGRQCLKHLATVRPQVIQRTAADQTFYRAAVKMLVA